MASTSRLNLNQKDLEEKLGIDFDYVASKEMYFKLIAKSSQKSKRLNKQMFNEIVSNLLVCEAKEKAGDTCAHLNNHTCYPHFQLNRDKDGKIFLTSVRKGDVKPIKHLVIEDSFDVFVNHHLLLNHCGQSALRERIRRDYEIRTMYIDLFTKSCNVCIAKNAKLQKRQDKKKEAVQKKQPYKLEDKQLYLDIENMHLCCDGEFKLILFCKDLITSYVLLRPLIARCHEEIAIELLKILMTFGSPVFTIWTPSENYNLILNAVETMKKYGLQNEATINSISGSKHGKTFTASLMYLRNWMTETSSTNWAIGCHIVQWEINNRQSKKKSKTETVNVDKIPKTAYGNTFHRHPSIFMKDDVVFSSDIETCLDNSDDEQNQHISQQSINHICTSDSIQNYLADKESCSDDDEILNSFNLFMLLDNGAKKNIATNLS